MDKGKIESLCEYIKVNIPLIDVEEMRENWRRDTILYAIFAQYDCNPIDAKYDTDGLSTLSTMLLQERESQRVFIGLGAVTVWRNGIESRTQYHFNDGNILWLSYFMDADVSRWDELCAQYIANIDIAFPTEDKGLPSGIYYENPFRGESNKRGFYVMLVESVEGANLLGLDYGKQVAEWMEGWLSNGRYLNKINSLYRETKMVRHHRGRSNVCFSLKHVLIERDGDNNPTHLIFEQGTFPSLLTEKLKIALPPASWVLTDRAMRECWVELVHKRVEDAVSLWKKQVKSDIEDLEFLSSK